MSETLRRVLRTPGVVTASVAVVVILAWLAGLGFEGARDAVAANWPVSLTMVLGSFVAGASSEGGGAVAFPVFTKLLHIAPPDAKLFALMIQSIGMTAASLTIFALNVRIDLKAIALASIGGAVGIGVSLLLVAPLAPPPEVRVLFTAMQAGFAFVLIRSLLRPGGRAAAARIGGWSDAAALIVAGLVGGVVSGLVGAGIDLVTFAVLTLLFRVSEKVATPTSVVLMAINSLVGVATYRLAIGPPPAEVTAMWLAAVPIVVIGAPLGAWFCALVSRSTIGWFLIGLISIEVVSTTLLIPWTVSTASVGIGVLVLCVGVCFLMAHSEPVGVTRRRESAAVYRDSLAAS